MFELSSFHRNLLKVACGKNPETSETAPLHQQQSALDILTWIMAIQVNDLDQRYNIFSNIEVICRCTEINLKNIPSVLYY